MIRTVLRQLVLAQAIDRAKRQRRRGKPRGVALCPTPSVQSNRGDEAMAEVCIRPLLAAGFPHVDLIQNGTQSSDYLNHLPGVVAIPTFAPGFYTEQALKEQSAFARYMAEREHLVVIGADIMDGSYGTSRAEAIAAMTHVAARVGARVRLICSSVAAPLDPRRLPQVCRLGQEVAVYARGADSYERLLKSGMKNLHQAADLALLLESQPFDHLQNGALAQFVQKDDRPLVGLSVSKRLHLPLVLHGCRRLSERHGCRFVVLTHSTTLSADGRSLEPGINGEFVDDLAATVGADNVFYLWPVPRAAEIKAHVFSAFMHLTLAALGMGTAVTGFAYNGKFEEQYRPLNAADGIAYAEHLPTDPDAFADWMVARFERSAEMAERIRAALPEVMALSAFQLEGVTPS